MHDAESASTATTADLLAFMRMHRYAVQATVSESGEPQAATVGVVVTDDMDVVFDTLNSTRKLRNLRHNAAVALVFGSGANGDERTLQYQGTGAVLNGADRERMQSLYFEQFPDGRERAALPELVYIRVTPEWIRYSDFGAVPPRIVEWRVHEEERR